MTALSFTNISCGVYQLYALNTNSNNEPFKVMPKKPKEVLKYVCYRLADIQTAFIIWSDTAELKSGGTVFYSYIKKTFPKSEIIRTSCAKNPNTGNKIATYVWKVPHEELKEWYEKWK